MHAKITIFYCCSCNKISWHWVKGLPSNKGVKRVPPKSRYFTATGSSSVKRLQIDTDLLLIITSTNEKLFGVLTSMTLNDLKPSKYEVLVIFAIFRLRRTFQKWIAPERLEADQDNLHMKFLPLNLDLSSLNFSLLDSGSFLYGSVKFRYFKCAISATVY